MMKSLNSENYEVLSIYIIIGLFFLVGSIQILCRLFTTFKMLWHFRKNPYKTLRDLDLETEFQQNHALQLSSQYLTNKNIDQNLQNRIQSFCNEQKIKLSYDKKNDQFKVQLEKQKKYSILKLHDYQTSKLQISDQKLQQRLKIFLIDFPLPEQLPIYIFKIDQELQKCIIVNQDSNSLKNMILQKKSKKYNLEINASLINKILQTTLKYIYKLNRLNLWHNHIDTSSIFVENDDIFIGNIEKMIFNQKIEQKYEHLRDKKSSFFKKNELIDILQFGHLIYELHFNFQCPQLYPQISNFAFLNKKTKDILRLIFSHNSTQVNLSLLLPEFDLNQENLDQQIPLELIQNLKY